MCDIMERLMQENNAQSYEKGVAQGEENANIKTIKNAIAKGYTYNDIAEIVNLSVEEVKGLAKA